MQFTQEKNINYHALVHVIILRPINKGGNKDSIPWCKQDPGPASLAYLVDTAGPAVRGGLELVSMVCGFVRNSLRTATCFQKNEPD